MSSHKYSHFTGIWQPLFCIIMAAAQCPALTHSSRFLPFTNLDKKPPANASPAPFVSIIKSSST